MRARAGRGYLLQCDVQNYFASVDHGVLVGLLARRVGDPRLLALLSSLVTHGGDQPGKGMAIGNLTSQLFANLYLDLFDHFVKETLRVRHYIRYMDDWIILNDGGTQARERLSVCTRFLAEHLRLRLNARRVRVAPLDHPHDFLGYVQHPAGRSHIRRRSVRRLWRRLPAIERRLGTGQLAWTAARASVASWFGLAACASAFQLSRTVFGRRDVRNIGKRLLVRAAGAGKAGAGP